MLEREELLLADAATHREALAAAHAAVEDTAIDAVGAAVGALDDRIPFAALATRLRSAQAELADIGDELRSAAEAVVDDPGRLEAVGQRRRMLHELRRKYGDSLAEVLAYAVQARARLEELEHHDEHAAELESVRQTCGVAVVERAAELTEARVAAAPVLAREIEARLRVLAMPRAGVEIRVEPGDTTDDGADRVEILLAPNPGEPARSLARAASGGELSRAMLAVRVVLSAAPPTLIFDEVDAGIGGEAGISVGRLLATLGGDHQVLCVTHLAQVAAFADHHVVVAKQVIDTDGERTVAVADRAEEDGRVVELSRMLAGDSASETARQHAADLLGSARDARAVSRGTRLPAGRS